MASRRPEIEARMVRSHIVLVTVAGLLIAACSAPGEDASGRQREVLVSAAASLTDAFGEIEVVFEEANPGVDVLLNLAGSSALREQIFEGAPADVFAPANRANMDQVVDAGLVAGESRDFATNSLTIAVPAGNPADVTGLEDFADADLLIGLCDEQVPCGVLARQSLAAAGVTPEIDTNEPDVRSLLTKISAGELDAGITYATDVAAAGGAVEGVSIPTGGAIAATYPIAVLEDAPNRGDALAFVDFVLSDEGRRILTQYGFGSP